MDFPVDITLRKTRMKFELTFMVVLLFSYQGFAFMRKLLYFITSLSICQELFQKIFHLLFKGFCSLRCELLYVITCYLICQDFFNFLLRFLSFFFQKCVSHVQRIL